jgi:hypothetical protein
MLFMMRPSSSSIARVQAACGAIAEVMDSPAFGSRLPNARLLRSAEEIDATRQFLPSAFLPFMTHRRPTSTDVYAFESGDAIGGKIVVWNDHAVVAHWSSFEAFIAWLRGDPVAAKAKPQ